MRSVVLVLALLISACSLVKPQPRVQPTGPAHLLVESLRFRQPGEGFSCVFPERFLSELKWEEVQGCLQSAQTVADISYLLDREEPKPEFVLEELPAEKAKAVPPCFTALLARIPVPREIYYQGEDLNCFASGLALGRGKIRLQVALPIKRSALETQEDTRALILSWVLTPFVDRKSRVIPALPLPESLCRQCLGEDHLIRSLHPPRSLWPADQ